MGSVYFWKIAKEWIPLVMFGCALALLSMLGAILMPESPKYLVTKGRYDEARTAITFIAKVNK